MDTNYKSKHRDTKNFTENTVNSDYFSVNSVVKNELNERQVDIINKSKHRDTKNFTENTVNSNNFSVNSVVK